MQAEELLLVSDLDGTLIPHGGSISRRSLEAIDRFRQRGGAFAVATGRIPSSAEPYVSQLKVETPYIANNGALIYHPGRKAPVWFKPLPDSFREIVADVRAHFPQVGIDVVDSEDRCYRLADCAYFHTSGGRQFYRGFMECDDPDVLPVECCKVLFALPMETFDQVKDEMLSRGYSGVEFTPSGGAWFEMMAGGVNKGSTLERLARLYGKELSHVVSVGDYYNDRELISRAGIGAAVNTAPPEIQKAAALLLPSCGEDGVAVLIDYLLSGEETPLIVKNPDRQML